MQEKMAFIIVATHTDILPRDNMPCHLLCQSCLQRAGNSSPRALNAMPLSNQILIPPKHCPNRKKNQNIHTSALPSHGSCHAKVSSKLINLPLSTNTPSSSQPPPCPAPQHQPSPPSSHPSPRLPPAQQARSPRSRPRSPQTAAGRSRSPWR